MGALYKWIRKSNEQEKLRMKFFLSDSSI